MGYTVQSARDMVALGVSAIGDVQGLLVQNTKKLTEYYEALDAGRFPTERGYVLDEDDAPAPPRDHRADVQRAPRRPRRRAPLRRRASPSTSRRSWPTWRRPARPQADGLVQVDADALDVTPVGRMFVRNVCMVFDRYLRARTAGPTPVFSRTV